MHDRCLLCGSYEKISHDTESPGLFWEGRMEEVKPCPFCGKHPDSWWDHDEPGYEEGFHIACYNCNIPSLVRVYKEDAIEAWNTRESTPAA